MLEGIAADWAQTTRVARKSVISIWRGGGLPLKANKFAGDWSDFICESKRQEATF
jgi:hypothetical protein